MFSPTVDLIFRLILGAVILLVGRNIFWLFIALIGFLAGIELAGIWLAGQPPWLLLLVGLGAGVTGAVLAIVLERVGFALAGFYAAVFLAMAYGAKLGLNVQSQFVLFGIGLVGAVLVALLTDWAIIFLSAMAGAAAILSVFNLQPVAEAVCLVVLIAIGVLVQRAMLVQQRKSA